MPIKTITFNDLHVETDLLTCDCNLTDRDIIIIQLNDESS